VNVTRAGRVSIPFGIGKHGQQTLINIFYQNQNRLVLLSGTRILEKIRLNSKNGPFLGPKRRLANMGIHGSKGRLEKNSTKNTQKIRYFKKIFRNFQEKSESVASYQAPFGSRIPLTSEDRSLQASRTAQVDSNSVNAVASRIRIW
jgi:hypothetical protein